MPQPLPMRTTTSQTKATLTGGQIFLRAVSCGYFVCLAMWMAALYTVPGNIVGAILLMGAAYAWLVGAGGSGGDATSGSRWRSRLKPSEVVARPTSPPLASRAATGASEQLSPASSTSTPRRRASAPPPTRLAAAAATRENGN
jgi:hypothetical protein